ncbi:MAG: hypothetical protein AB7U82_01140 [Blastocatellales bacterium]
MKKTKDTVTGQLVTAEKQNLVACLATLGINGLAHSIPMDSNAKFVAAGTTPSPRTIEAEVQDWLDVIHAQTSFWGQSLNVLHRGTFCGVENIWGFAFDKTTPIGTAASAASDGDSTWCGRYYNYLYNIVGNRVINGDIFAPIPEGTTHAFDGNFFVSSQNNYHTLFSEFRTITNTYAAAKGVSVVFMSHNNFSELYSGWLFGSMFTDQGFAGADYYGQVQGTLYNRVEDYITDWLAIHNGGHGNAAGKPLFWGEWGDISGNAMPSADAATIEKRLAWLIRYYKAVRDNLVDPGKMVGYNYWGGWEGQNTSLLYKTGSGASSQYFLNARGKILAAFLKSQAGISRVPVITAGSGADSYTF